KGLRGYLPAAEGRGLMVEQLAYDTWSEFMATRRFADVARRHLSIGLARGVDGAGERDFKQVFHIMHAIDKLWELVQTPTEPEQASTRAIDRTWELLTKRTLKGVVGTGAAYFKDKVYAEGNHAQLQLHLQHPEVKPYINKGSYDLTNADHRSILKRIGAIPVWLLA
ncbi:MAG: Coiled-coil, partial [Candidatus Saccharibacteria bacterium]|nr:Coiled-coil [Candidatus Saccharibacteria bacterium]